MRKSQVLAISILVTLLLVGSTFAMLTTQKTIQTTGSIKAAMNSIVGANFVGITPLLWEKPAKQYLEALQKLNVNRLRFWGWKEFSVDNTTEVEKLKAILDRIDTYNMSATVCLTQRDEDWGFLRGYPTDPKLAIEDFRKLYTAIGTHPAIHSWDLRNEPLFDNEAQELDWLRQVMAEIKVQDPVRPSYIGLGGTRVLRGYLEKIINFTDVAAVHYYPMRGSDEFYDQHWIESHLPNDFHMFMTSVRNQNTRNLPVWIDETGAGTSYKESTYNGYTDEKGQDYQFRLTYNEMVKYPEIQATSFWQANYASRFSVFNDDMTEKLCCQAIREFYGGTLPSIPEME